MQVSQMKRAISQEQWKQRIVECRNSGVPVKKRRQRKAVNAIVAHDALQLCESDTALLFQH